MSAGDAQGQRYRFDGCRFERVRAHGGSGEISSARVLSRVQGPLRFVDLSILPPQSDIGCHTHSVDNEELYIVVAGRGVMTLDGQEFEVGPGHVIVNRPGGTHGLRNVGAEELRIVVIEVDAR
jgi:quercetin dioxygenase-like cupin family protein